MKIRSFVTTAKEETLVLESMRKLNRLVTATSTSYILGSITKDEMDEIMYETNEQLDYLRYGVEYHDCKLIYHTYLAVLDIEDKSNSLNFQLMMNA